MCGIAGIFAPGGSAEPSALTEPIERLNRLQAHRGPDGTGIWSDDRHCALGHRRLAVIDLSPGGHQPMTDPSGRYTITFNGEIYNYRALRAELEAKGHRFRSQSDTEVLLAAYVEHGDEVFAQLDGMFALALYDATARRLVLARDRAGEKPLFYTTLPDGRFVFASELRALTTLPGAGFRLDPHGVFAYLALRYVPAPGTVLEGVFSLEAGTTLSVGPDGGRSSRAFFAYDRRVDPPPQDPEALIDQVEEALTSSIRLRLASDVPLGAFLSSGIDSGLVCALAARRLGQTIHTFCAGFVGVDGDETDASRRVAQALGLPHESYRISADDLVSTVAGFGRCLDEPNGDRSCVPVYLLSREMRRAVTVALSGDGGDELFCGYDRYAAFSRLESAAREPDPIAQLERYFAEVLPVFELAALARALPDEYATWRERFLARYAPVLLRASWSVPQRLSVLDFHTYLPGAVLAKVDRMSMRHALEVRTPFLEPRMFKLSAALEPTQCGGPSGLKPVLRRLLARHLGADHISARKVGFGMPPAFMRAHQDLFRGLYEAACETLKSTTFFGERPDAFAGLAEAAPRNANSLWAWTVLGLWVDSTGVGV